MGLFFRDRYFVVLGVVVNETGAKGKYSASVTLRARNHDDAERQAFKEFLIGDEMMPERFFRVKEVREIRRG